MRKIFFFACLLACTIAWAAKPEQIVRAYMGQHGGYVLVDANNEVIGMSDNNTALEVSDGVRNFLEAHGKKIEIVRANLPAEITTPMVVDSFGPLLGDITFGQSAPYNRMTPTVGGKQCVTGCVATAMTQILTYWKYPDVCADTVIEYQTAGLGLQVKFDYRGCEFDWDNVLHSYKGVAATEIQKDAVAKVMSACGVSVQMNYTTESSGSHSPLVPGALVNVFKFKKGLKFQLRGSDLTPQEFSDALYKEFKEGRPAYCSGVSAGRPGEPDGGHAFVLDGIKTTDKSDYRKSYIHFNWGWDGASNDWLRITGETPYSDDMRVIIGIEPDQATGLFDATATDFVKDGRIYDMMGHVVTETISGNLYIRNGEKFMAQ